MDSRAAASYQVIQCEHSPRPPGLRRISFGATAAIVTSMALIVGLDAATATRTTTVGALLIIGLADNLTDSLGVHVYQESERLAEREALRTTVTNFAARLLVSCSFIALILFWPAPVSIYIAVAWGATLLSGLSFLLARARNVNPVSEIWKHCSVALAVIALSKAIGTWIPDWIGLF